MKFILNLCIAILLPMLVSGQSINSEKSQISFDIKNMFKTVNGSLGNIYGTITFDEANLSSSIFDVCIPVITMNTKNDKRDEHLMAQDYFNSEFYEDICFVASTVSETNIGYIVHGDLTMHGITKIVGIPFTYVKGQFEGSLIIDRYDYGIGGSGGFMMGREVEVKIFVLTN